ncbi:hypothetical protein PG991_010218 [Apiospora marii]|uniref:N-acetyltransferase domain-containing protein n=1 Tax=Apiospora marii TaxID=335849 RepID=A0ABR1RI41_9PEZI
MEASNGEKEVTLGSNNKECLDKTLAVLGPAFADDAIFAYFVHHHPSPARRRALIQTLLRLFVRVGAAAVFLPPGRGVVGAVVELGFTSIKRMYTDLIAPIERLKRQHLTPEERAGGYGYLTVVGTAPARQGQGLGGALLRRMQALATAAGGRPIWLEASSEGSRRLYERHGFVVVGEVVAGRGVVGADGLARDGGEGVRCWAMVWRRGKGEEEEEGDEKKK